MIPVPFTGRLLRSAATACAAILTGLLGVSLQAAPPTEMPSKVKLVADPSPAVPSPKASAFGLRVARNVGLPAPDLADAIAEDSAVAAQSDAKAPRRIGIKRPIAPVESADADWNVLPDGSRVWVGRFESAGAQGIRLHFSSVTLPAGAVLIAYDAAQPQYVEGPFDAAYLGGRDSFWSSTVFAASVVVEAHVPAGAGPAAFTVTELTHNYRSTKSDEAKNAGACERDFTCELTDWGTTGNAVSGIGAVAQNGSIFCTGCLLNDQNPAPGTDYYLTANHCITGQAAASTLEFYWLYQTPTCNGVEPNLATVPRTRGGADLLSNRARGTGTDMNDHSFLRLRGTVPAGVTYAGWSVSAPAAGEVITCIHHPDGDYKRISHGTINAPLSTANFWNILWTPGRGVTEPGSSGSPIFNAQKQVIGQLFGGPSGCANTNPADQNDDFGRFAITYSYIRAWLLNETPPPPPTAPTNDAFATPRVLTGGSGSVTADSSNATRESGDPAIAGNSGGASLWFRWTAPAAGAVTFDTVGSGFDTLLGVYRGTSLAALTVLDQNDDISGGNASRVAFTAVAGTTYLIAVDGYNAASGAIVLNWTGPVGPVLNNDNFANALVIAGATGQVNGSNTNYTREAGEPTHQPAGFPAAEVGQRSAWWTWTSPASGPATFDTVGSSFDTVLAVYTGTAVGSLTPIAQNDDINFDGGVFQSRVTFTAVAGTVYRIAVDGYLDSGPPVVQEQGAIVLNWSGATPPPPPGNDNFTNSIVITGGTGQATGSNTNYTHEAGEPGHDGNANTRSAWWRWTAPAGGPVTFTTAGSSFDTILAVYTGTAVNALTEVASNDDVSNTVLTSTVTFQAVAGTTYQIAVDGFRSTSGAQAQGAIVLNWTGPVGPVLSNDNFANAAALAGGAGRANGSNTNYTREAGEPTHQPAGFPAAEVGQRSAWWTWTAPVSGQVAFDTVGSSFDTVLAVYTGTAVGSLTQVAQNDDINSSNLVSRVTFAAVAGTTYRIAVDGYRDPGPPVDQAEGSIVLNWSGPTPPPPTERPDLIVWTPSLLPALEFRTFAAGDCAVNEGCGIVGRRRLLTFDTEVRNQGTADVRLGVPGPSNTNFVFDPCHGHYHWLGYAHYRLVGTNGVVATGRKVGFCLLDSLHWSTTNGPSTSRYDCQNQGISVGWGDVYGRHLSCQYVDVTDVVDGDYFLEVEVDPNNQFNELDESNNVGRVPVHIGPVVTPANDDFASARVVHLATGLVHGNSAGASSQPGEPPLGAGATVWFRWTAPCTGTAVFDTEGTVFDTFIAAYSGTAVGGLTQLAFNDDSGTGNWSRISFAATAGTDYSIKVDGYSATDAGPFRLHWAIQGGSCPIPPRPLPLERPSAAGAFTVDFFGETGETYAMDVTESLSSPWIRLLTTTGEGRQMTFTDNSANQHTSRYYRIVQVNP